MLAIFLIHVLLAPFAACSPYVVTDYVVLSISTIIDPITLPGLSSTQTLSGDYYTVKQHIIPTIKAIPQPLSASTTVRSTSEIPGGITVVQAQLPADAGAPKPTEGVTNYYIDVTYSSCSDGATKTSNVALNLPSELNGLFTPITATTSYPPTDTAHERPQVSILIHSSDLEPAVVSSVLYEYQPMSCSDVSAPSATIRPDASGECSNGHNTHNATCGDVNPCCVGCSFYTEYCIGNACPPYTRHYWECHGGAKFYDNGSSARATVAISAVVGAVILGWLGFWLASGI